MIHRFFNFKKSILYKDPFMSICSNYFLEQDDSTKVLYLIRHPLSFLKSNIRMNWDFDFNLFPIDMVLLDYPEIKNKIFTENIEQRLFTLYNIVYYIIFKIINKYPNRTLLIRHEDFCINPEKNAKIICNFFEIDFTSNHKKFIERNMKNKKIISKEVNNSTLEETVLILEKLFWSQVYQI